MVNAMNELSSISPTGTLVLTVPARAASTASAPELPDQLELSDVAQILARLPLSTEIRAEKVAQVRQAIQDGTYESPDKLAYTIDRLMDVLNLR
jgi:anti-sigma28 factor (negative regulator of flagellin synthesis)